MGRFSAQGHNIEHLTEGERTLVPVVTRSWIEQVKAKEDYLRPLPDTELNQLSMRGINLATANSIMAKFMQLNAGD
ncbi:hypothetical protein [Paraburkholderia sp. 32]|uniref:hypothetical protein n=1 Tax=Paraburkholderia sp. 32 TaxID=2991057 RepID=UPI003D2614DA